MVQGGHRQKESIEGGNEDREDASPLMSCTIKAEEGGCGMNRRRQEVDESLQR